MHTYMYSGISTYLDHSHLYKQAHTHAQTCTHTHTHTHTNKHTHTHKHTVTHIQTHDNYVIVKHHIPNSTSQYTHCTDIFYTYLFRLGCPKVYLDTQVVTLFMPLHTTLKEIKHWRCWSCDPMHITRTSWTRKRFLVRISFLDGISISVTFAGIWSTSGTQ